MDLKIQLQENKTKNEEFMRKIDKIEYRMAEASLSKVVSLHSVHVTQNNMSTNIV